MGSITHVEFYKGYDIMKPVGQTKESFLKCKNLNIKYILDDFKYYFNSIIDCEYFSNETQLQIGRTLKELEKLQTVIELDTSVSSYVGD